MKHEFKVIPKEEVLENRSNAYEFINFDKKDMKQSAVEWLEEKLIEAGLQFTKGEALEIEQAKEMENEQKGYSEEEVLDILFSMSVENPKDITEWFNNLKNK